MATKRNMGPSAVLHTGNETATKVTVERAFDNASNMLRDAGFRIKSRVDIAVDPKLPFMGYTMPQRGSFRIVVSGGAVGSGLLEGLLVHEMSHIYRMQTNHPSHNGEIIERAINGLGKEVLVHDYQQKIVHDILNDIQDLYADDIAFKVLRKTPILDSGQMTGFLQDWVKEEPVKSEDSSRDGWMNASIMVHNARAIAQMARHRVEDTGGRAARSNERFLSRISPAIARQFDYFRGVLENLREDMTEDEYQRLLADYLRRFLETTEKN